MQRNERYILPKHTHTHTLITCARVCLCVCVQWYASADTYLSHCQIKITHAYLFSAFLFLSFSPDFKVFVVVVVVVDVDVVLCDQFSMRVRVGHVREINTDKFLYSFDSRQTTQLMVEEEEEEDVEEDNERNKLKRESEKKKILCVHAHAMSR